jgi:hypothetical protein
MQGQLKSVCCDDKDCFHESTENRCTNTFPLILSDGARSHSKIHITAIVLSQSVEHLQLNDYKFLLSSSKRKPDEALNAIESITSGFRYNLAHCINFNSC